VRFALARELHDAVAQSLATMLLEMEGFKAEQVGRASVLREIDELQASTRSVLASLRRVLFQLRDEQVENGQLVDGIRALLATVEERTGVIGTLRVTERWPNIIVSAVASQLYRIVQEALRNAALHSGAQSIDITLDATVDFLRLTIRDNGRGILIGDEGFGTLGMRERAVLLGGDLVVETEVGSGTAVEILVPMRYIR